MHISQLHEYLSFCSDRLTAQTQTVLSSIVFATGLWFSLIMLLRCTLKVLLSYHGWIFEPHGKMSMSTKLWMVNTNTHTLSHIVMKNHLERKNF